VTAEQAREIYGVVLACDGSVDAAATAARRAEIARGDAPDGGDLGVERHCLALAERLSGYVLAPVERA